MKLYYAFMVNGRNPTDILFTFKKFLVEAETIIYEDCIVEKTFNGFTPQKTVIIHGPSTKLEKIIFDKEKTLYIPRNGSLDTFTFL